MTALTHEEVLKAVEQAGDLLDEMETAVRRLPKCQEDRNRHRKACIDALVALRDDDPGVALSILVEIVEGP